MMDQAEILRQLASKSSGLNEKSKIITITSGKGGVGKSNFVVNLAIALAKEGKKILLFVQPSILCRHGLIRSLQNTIQSSTTNIREIQ